MRISLFENAGFVGIPSERSASASGSFLRLELPFDGELSVCGRQLRVRDGEAYLPISVLEVGESSPLSFKRSDGTVFDCGCLCRTGGLSFALDAPALRALGGLCAEGEAQRSRILQLEARIREIEKKYGISVI